MAERKKNSIMTVDFCEGDALSLTLHAEGWDVINEVGENVKKRLDHEILKAIIINFKNLQDSLTLCNEITSRQNTPPIIIIAEKKQLDDIIQLAREKEVEYLVRPFELKELVFKIEQAGKIRGLRIRETISNIKGELFSIFDLYKLLAAVVRHAEKVLEADEISIMLLDEHERELCLVASTNLDDEFRGTTVPLEQSVSGGVILQGTPAIINDTPENSIIDSPKRDFLYSSIVYPLIYERHVLGTLNINRTKTKRRFTSCDLELAGIFCRDVSLTLLNVMGHQKINIEIIIRAAKRARFTNTGGEISCVKAPAPGVDIIYRSEAMREIINTAMRIALADVTILIQGESGVGKEILAKFIHASSKRATHPFIILDCGSLPESLAESELFGYDKGSFTGAYFNKKGFFEIASGGSIFLDEIGNIVPSIQAKLLRVLDIKKITRVGGRQETDVDVRIITASNLNLKEAVSRGLCRMDFYQRVSQFVITIPPLRDRKDDIIPLAEFFLEQMRVELNRKNFYLSKQGRQLLLDYDWPGNVRELKNVIRRGALSTDSEIVPEKLLITDRVLKKLSDFSKKGPDEENVECSSIKDMEKELILNALKKAGNNKKKAASLLKMPRSTFYNKLKKYELLV